MKVFFVIACFASNSSQKIGKLLTNRLVIFTIEKISAACGRVFYKLKSPQRSCIKLIAVKAAVSVRNIRGPNEKPSVL